MAQIRTFKNLQDEVLALLDEAGDTSTTLTLVKNALNAAHQKRMTEERWSFMLWDSEETISIVAPTQSYSLHSELFRPLYFWNDTVKDYMTQYNEGNVVASGADWHSDTNSALKFTLWAKTEVQAQPTAASFITVASSVPADNGSKTVTVKGDTAQGVRSETISSGSTGSVSFTKILKVTKGDAWAGTMTLTSNAAAVTNLVLFAEEFGRSYQKFELLEIPQQAETVKYKFYRLPSQLVANNDRTDFPVGFEMIAAYDALLALSTYNQYDPMTVANWKGFRDDLLTDLRQSLTDQAESLEAATSYTHYVPR